MTCAPEPARPNPDPRKVPLRSSLPPLVLHVIHRLDFGGLENGVVNLINHMPQDRYRHAVLCMTECTPFRARIRRDGVQCLSLHRKPGKSLGTYRDVWSVVRRIRPDIVHTRNLPTADLVFSAAWAGVHRIVHGEHGLSLDELQGRNRKYVLLRRLSRLTVDRYVAVSQDLARWLRDSIHVPAEKVVQIHNGVDTALFHPPTGAPRDRPSERPAAPDGITIGTVGRMEPIKDPLNLVRAFLILRRMTPDLSGKLRLALVGDGPLRAEAAALLESEGAMSRAWLPGSRNDVPALMRTWDVFVLPSRSEGISNTILEAMASGLPVVATAVGGNPELVVDGVTGALVPAADPRALADALLRYVRDPGSIDRQGLAARQRAEREFSLEQMVRRYAGMYDGLTAPT